MNTKNFVPGIRLLIGESKYSKEWPSSMVLSNEDEVGIVLSLIKSVSRKTAIKELVLSEKFDDGSEVYPALERIIAEGDLDVRKVTVLEEGNKDLDFWAQSLRKVFEIEEDDLQPSVVAN